nr:hypothetical protein [Tanacetum cinerariifolium]
VYQNFLVEFWSTVVAFNPFPSIDEPEKRPFKEFLIKFSVSNGPRPLTHISINPSYLDKTPVLKNSFPVAWRILFTVVIQIFGGNYSFTEQVNSIQQLLAYSIITGTEVDIGEIIYSDIITMLLNKSRDITFATPGEATAKTTPCLEGSLGDKDSGVNKPPTDMEPLHSIDADLSGTGAKKPDTQPIILSYADVRAILLSEDEAQEIKDDPVTNKKIEEAFETFSKIFTHTTEILSSDRSFDFSTLLTTVKNIQDHTFKQEEVSAAWMKSSTNMA